MTCDFAEQIILGRVRNANAAKITGKDAAYGSDVHFLVNFRGIPSEEFRSSETCC